MVRSNYRKATLVCWRCNPIIPIPHVLNIFKGQCTTIKNNCIQEGSIWLYLSSRIYEGCSINNETVLITFCLASTWNKTQFYIKIKLISYYLSNIYRLITNNLGKASISITIVTHYLPRSNYFENAILWYECVITVSITSWR